ncbi:hypothetical protein PU560_11220, partial [Georgenia sp. 10Sc9-8]|nr:hypothetical protein [Georgenia halotolerans]
MPLETFAQGSSSDAEAFATVVAAVIAAVAAITAAVMSAVSARRSRVQTRHLEQVADARYREYTGREHWWTRFSWALEKATATNVRDVELGLLIIKRLLSARWATPEDARMGLATLDMIESPRDVAAPMAQQQPDARIHGLVDEVRE